MSTEPKIEVQPNGPYVVKRGAPLRRKRPIVSAHGEPIGWSSDDAEPQDRVYALCRCGGSANKPYCDGTHARSGFDGTETAPPDSYRERAREYQGTGIVVRDDRGICEHAGFCGNRVTNVWKMVGDTSDSTVRAQVIAMVERCPSGALTLEVDSRTVEPDLPVEIGLIEDGPLYVTEGIAVHRVDGQPFETRNHVTLCRCGGSKNKPLCDGTHKEIGFRTP